MVSTFEQYGLKPQEVTMTLHATWERAMSSGVKYSKLFSGAGLPSGCVKLNSSFDS
jgi:hypothetical protein